MKKGNTSTGFEFVIEDAVLDDWELLENLRAIDKGEEGLIVDVAHTLLGEEQMAKLKEHVKKTTGRISISAMGQELGEILNADDETKN